MANSQLYGEQFALTDEIKIHLQQCVARYSNSKYGTPTLRNILNNGYVDYSDLKNLKSIFGNVQYEPYYEQYGGGDMKAWVNLTLNRERDKIETSKKNKSFMGNQYMKDHEKPQLVPRLKLSESQVNYLKSIFFG